MSDLHLCQWADRASPTSFPTVARRGTAAESCTPTCLRLLPSSRTCVAWPPRRPLRGGGKEVQTHAPAEHDGFLCWGSARPPAGTPGRRDRRRVRADGRDHRAADGGRVLLPVPERLDRL